jgi:hypothetical protein
LSGHSIEGADWIILLHPKKLEFYVIELNLKKKTMSTAIVWGFHVVLCILLALVVIISFAAMFAGSDLKSASWFVPTVIAELWTLIIIMRTP